MQLEREDERLGSCGSMDLSVRLCIDVIWRIADGLVYSEPVTARFFLFQSLGSFAYTMMPVFRNIISSPPLTLRHCALAIGRAPKEHGGGGEPYSDTDWSEIRVTIGILYPIIRNNSRALR